MKDVKYQGYIIKQTDVKKIRSLPKKKLDLIPDYDIYQLFLQMMEPNNYKANCQGIYLLNYMEKYRNTSEMILPMHRFLSTGDMSYFTDPKIRFRYRHAL